MMSASAAAQPAPSAGAADYLIITADDFYEEILPLAAWKQQKGYPTFVARMSDVGTTSADVKSYISEAFHADDRPPRFVLLVGDHENVPSWEWVGEPNKLGDPPPVWHSDYDSACVDGNDALADLAIGRLPGDTETQVATMVDKILGYELAPDLGSWYDDALLAAQFQDKDSNHIEDRSFMEDIHRTADFFGGDFDFWAGRDPHNQGYTIHTTRVWDSGIGHTLHYADRDYPGRIPGPDPVPAKWINHRDEAIAAAINSGVGLVVHRDHGGTDGWGQPRFRTADVQSLTNGSKLPVVFSINCSSGAFASVDAFAESWLRNANGGAVAFIGAEANTKGTHNDALLAGLFDSMWNDYDTSWQSTHYASSWHLGEVLNYAKDRVFSGFPNQQEKAMRTATKYNLLGDPEMMLRTATPSSLSVTHVGTVGSRVPADFTAFVTKGTTPVPGARVCLSKAGSSDYYVGETGLDGKVVFRGMTLSDLGDYDLVVTERNAVPYFGSVRSRPVVTVVATDTSAHEGTEDSGTILISRTGPTTSALTVRFGMSGTATGWTDYQLVGALLPYTSVTIPADSSSKTIELRALQDALSEPTEYAILTLNDDSSYRIEGPNCARISIVNSHFGVLPHPIEPLPPIVSPPSLGAFQVTAVLDRHDDIARFVDGQPTGVRGGSPLDSCLVPVRRGDLSALADEDWESLLDAAQNCDLFSIVSALGPGLGASGASALSS